MMVSMCPYGLGNKIRSLMACIVSDPDPKACWAPGGATTGAFVNCVRFSDLFANPLEIREPQIPADAGIRRHHFLDTLDGDADPVGTWDLLNDGGLRHPEKRIRLAPDVTAAYVRAAQMLEPVRGIRDLADGVLSRLPPAFTAVHVRTWSANPSRVSRRRHAAFMKRGGIALYCSILDELPAGEALFVASDSPEALATVLQRYGARRIVVSTAASSIGSRILREFEWALADMLVMSRASRIVRSWESTFGEVAWWIGGARAEEVTVRDHSGMSMDPWFDLPSLYRAGKQALLGLAGGTAARPGVGGARGRRGRLEKNQS